MHYDKTTKVFEGIILDFPEDGTPVKLATVRVNCGPRGWATIKLSIATSPKGNPVVSMRCLKPKIGEQKRRHLMAVPRIERKRKVVHLEPPKPPLQIETKKGRTP